MQVGLCIHGSKPPWMRKKNLIPETSKKQNLNSPGADNYLHSIYTVLGILSNLQTIQTTQEGVCRLYVNTYAILYEGLGHLQILVSRQSSEPILQGYLGTTVYHILQTRRDGLVNKEDRFFLKSRILASNNAVRMNM